MRRKKGHSGQAQSGGDGRLTPAEIQQVEFRLAFRGYNERDVDAFLDRITEDLSTYIEENQGLRSGAGARPPETAPSGKGSEAAAREAEGIVARAKERAAQIVRDAEAASASAGGPSAVAGATDPRAAIAPFLSREREFLQSLGGLVQDHAEEIKGLVLAHRTKAGSGARAVPTVSASDASDPGSGAGPEPERDRREVAPPQPSPVQRPEPVVPTEEVVRTEEMESARTGEPEPVPAERPSGERSLRDLFWGED
jgi:DivIVA domain-containing protein